MSVMTRLRLAAQKRAAYNRTVHEIENMPLDVALDVGIHPGDAREIAHKVVYGG